MDFGGLWRILLIMTSYASVILSKFRIGQTYPCSAVFHYLRVVDRVSILAKAHGWSLVAHFVRRELKVISVEVIFSA